MPKIDPVLSEEDVVLAGELALGVLEGEDLAAARRRLIAEPAFAREVDRWRDHFAMVALRGPEVIPSAGVEDRVQQAVWAQTGRAPASLTQRAVARWRAAAVGFAGLAFSAAAALVLVLVRPPVVEAPMGAPVLVAALDAPAARATLLARIKPGRLQLTGALPVPEQRDAQAWVIDASGTPRSLGVLRRAGDQGLETVPQRALAPGQTLAISIEPLGGAPGPLPTGPVVATGKILTL
ncbi:anti-sigma factor [Novosphingobium sp. KACC 22771]|uniref:anti-sigma factor n=1 Tax=Novosphingobium sp. KACC 22771 TaxID=3025670 RepID=UPI002366B0F4|nr:anti-sigma factor [Novosphingobium sp. KACC 22771]WDF74519.1 anti-sigma factor [Novosphingobium sp. KACC 22771]